MSGKRLNFGPYAGRSGGLNFEEYVLNALNRIEKWSYDVRTRFDTTTEPGAVTSFALMEDGSGLLLENGDHLGLEA